ncbi:MAG: thioredoxin family protein [Victivallaceae bacterium]
MNSLKLILLFIVATTGVICLGQQLPGSCSSATINSILAVESTGVDNATADKTVKAKLPKLLDLGSKKCVPCKMMAPILEKLEKEYTGILRIEFIDVWVKENVEIAERYKISAIPTQIFFDAEGKELWRHTGYLSEEDILKQWKTLGYDFEKIKSANNK